MEGEEPMDRVISLVVAAIVGIVLVVGAFLPIASGQSSWAMGEGNIPGINSITGGSATIGTLLSVVVIMVIVGLIVGVVSYLKSR